MLTEPQISTLLTWLGRFGWLVCLYAIFIWVRGSFTARGNTTTKAEQPVAFLLTVAVLLFVGLALVFVGYAQNDEAMLTR